MGKRISQLAEITTVDSNDLLNVVDVSDTTYSASGTNKRVTKANLLKEYDIFSGWIPAGETWTYASADDPTYTFTVAADVTTKYSVGMKIKLTQGTVKYFIITAVSTFSGGNTTITVYGGTDYDLANSAISANAYSMMRTPVGFPMSPAKWSVVASDATVREQINPTQNTWYNLGSFSISIPIGVWNTYFIAQTYNSRATAGTLSAWVSLSTANNSASTAAHTVRSYNAADTGLMDALYNSFVISVASKTTYYLVEKTDQTGVTSLILNPGNETSRIVATCAYL